MYRSRDKRLPDDSARESYGTHRAHYPFDQLLPLYVISVAHRHPVVTLQPLSLLCSYSMPTCLRAELLKCFCPDDQVNSWRSILKKRGKVFKIKTLDVSRQPPSKIRGNNFKTQQKEQQQGFHRNTFCAFSSNLQQCRSNSLDKLVGQATYWCRVLTP